MGAVPLPAGPLPDQAVPAQAVPAQAVPAQPVPAQPVPAQPVPAQAVPAQPVPVQVFSGQDPGGEIRIDQPHTVRSAQFSKAAPDTRLRITYRDRAVTAGSANEFTATMVVRIDGVHVPLLDTVFDSSAGSLGGFPIHAVSAPFTTVGWVTGIGAGTHVLDTAYLAAGTNPPIVGFISGSPFLIEVVELP